MAFSPTNITTHMRTRVLDLMVSASETTSSGICRSASQIWIELTERKSDVREPQDSELVEMEPVKLRSIFGDALAFEIGSQQPAPSPREITSMF